VDIESVINVAADELMQRAKRWQHDHFAVDDFNSLWD
jgi:hypothetical protein